MEEEPIRIRIGDVFDLHTVPPRDVQPIRVLDSELLWQDTKIPRTLSEEDRKSSSYEKTRKAWPADGCDASRLVLQRTP